MKAVAICGSPRKNGNTEQLLGVALATLETHGIDAELIPLSGKSIFPCTACMACAGERRCALKDDFDPIFNAMLDADAVIVGSPVYFGSATPELMALLDRAGYISRHHGHLFARKIGGPVAVARRIGQNFTIAQLLMWYMANGLVVPGSTYWNIAFGGREKGDVLQDEEAVRTIRAFGENIAWLLHKTRNAPESSVC